MPTTNSGFNPRYMGATQTSGQGMLPQPGQGGLPPAATQQQIDPDSMRAMLVARGVPPEQIDQLLQGLASAAAGKGGIYSDQMDQARALRDTASAQGRTTRGGIYTAANPLEHLGVGMARYRGQQDMDEARKTRLGDIDTDRDSRSRLIDVMSRMGGGGQGMGRRMGGGQGQGGYGQGGYGRR